MKRKLIITEKQLHKLKKSLLSENNIEEYDYTSFDVKTGAMPSDRKEKILNWAQDRQISQGVIVKAVDNEARISIIPKDIVLYKNDDYLKDYFNRLELGGKYSDKYPLSNHIKRHDSYQVSLVAPNSVYFTDESKSILSCDIKLWGKLVPLNDKNWPKLRFDVYASIIEYSGAGRLIPENRKGANILSNKIKDLFNEYYGKYEAPRKGNYKLFIPEINLHPNTFIA